MTIQGSVLNADPPLTYRPEDERECQKNGWASCADATRWCVSISTESFIVKVEGEPMAVWGWRAVGKTAHIWLFSTPVVAKRPLTFWRESKRTLATLEANFTHLRCVVDEDYARSRVWVERLGFTHVGWTVPGFCFYYKPGRAV